jgi:hypothetical protein
VCVVAPAMHDNPYRSIAPMPTPCVRPPLQFAPEAMTWRPEYATPTMPAPHEDPRRHIAPNVRPRLQHTPEAMAWRPEYKKADLEALARVKIEEVGSGGSTGMDVGGRGEDASVHNGVAMLVRQPELPRLSDGPT